MDEVHFKNTDSFRYAKNGVPYGKRIIRQSMDDYQGFKNLILVNVDFLAIRPLFEEENTTANHYTSSGKNSGENNPYT